eukprot:12894729-Prorocentrum_lima.AAC.1
MLPITSQEGIAELVRHARALSMGGHYVFRIPLLQEDLEPPMRVLGAGHCQQFMDHALPP